MSRDNEETEVEATRLFDFRQPPPFYLALNGEQQGHLAALAAARSFGSVLSMVPRGNVKLVRDGDILEPIRDVLFAVYHPFNLDMAPSFNTLDEYDYEKVFATSPTADVARVIATSACMHAAEARNTKNAMRGWTAIVLSALSFSVSTLAQSTDLYESIVECFEDLLNDFSERAQMDSQYLTTGDYQSLLGSALWGELPQREWQRKFAMGAFDRVTYLGETKNDWSFWGKWFEDWLLGRPTAIGLMISIYNISDPIWQKGAEAVAAEIERIQAEHFTHDHPLAETTDINPDTGRFFSTPVPIQNTPLIGALLSQVQDSLEDATLGNNGLNETSRETRVLTRTLTRYANDPQRIEMDFTSVAIGLRRQIHDTGELPNSENNLALLASVEDGVRGIRAAHSDVAENRLLLAQQSMRELPQDKIELLEDALPMLIAMSEDVMAEDFAADIPSLINDALLPLPNGAPPLAGADVSTRIFTRVSHMRLMYDQFVDAGSKAFDSKTFKTARLGLTVVGMLSGLVSLGLFLFGVI